MSTQRSKGAKASNGRPNSASAKSLAEIVGATAEKEPRNDPAFMEGYKAWCRENHQNVKIAQPDVDASQEHASSTRPASAKDPRRAAPKKPATPEPAQRPSLEDALAAAQAKAGPSGLEARPTKAPNPLYTEYVQGLAKLQGLIGKYAPVAGPGGLYGFCNPLRLFARKERAFAYDDISDRSYNLLARSVEEMSTLWEGQETMQGMQLARNALVFAVLSDPRLAHQALRRAETWLAGHIKVLEDNDENLL